MISLKAIKANTLKPAFIILIIAVAAMLISPSQWHWLPTRRPMNHQAR